MEGYISSYWEQGWEGYSLQVFQDAAHCDEQTGQWSFDGTYLIEEGDVLSIYSQDGSVLWEGEVRHHRDGILARWWAHLRGRTPTVSAEQWKAWFDHKPPLKARLRIPSGASRESLRKK